MELIIADASGRDLRMMGDFALDMDVGWGDGTSNTFELQCAEGVPGAAWRVYADGTEAGGRVEGYKLQTSRTGRLLKWTGSTWAGVLEKRLLWPGRGQDYLTFSGDANGLLRWAVARLGLGGLFRVPDGEAGIAVSWRCLRDEPDAWTNLRLALRSAGARMKAEWSHGSCSLSAEAVVDWTDRVDTDLVDFDLTGDLLPPNRLLIAGEGELAARAWADVYANARGAVSTSQSLTGSYQVDYFHDSNGTAAVDLIAEGSKKLSELQSQGSVEVTVRDGWEPGLGDLVTGSDRSLGVSVTAEITGRRTRATGAGAAVTYTADGSSAAVRSIKERSVGQ